jgi:hypothetical protein
LQTSDGGYILGGASKNTFSDAYDMYLIKIDRFAKLEWEKTYGGTGSDACFSVIQTGDGGYILGGESNSFGNDPHDYDMYLVKIDAAGNTEWERTYGGDESEGCHSVQQTKDGGYILAGDSNSYSASSFDMYLVKTDPEGNLEWDRTFGERGWDECFSITETDDGCYCMVGCTESPETGDFDMYLVKVNVQGNLLWEKTIGNDGNDYGYSITRNNPGNYVIGGYSESTGATGDKIWIVNVAMDLNNWVSNKLMSRR